MRTNPSSCLLVGLLAAVGLCLPVHGRPVKIWTYEEMLEEADLVVIATAKSSRDDGVRVIDPRPNSWKGVLTTFDAMAVLKGKVERATFDVLHYRYFDKNAPIPPDGPGFVRFDAGGRTEYLLFLKKKEIAYEAVSGQMDPWVSVRIVRQYSEPVKPTESPAATSAPPATPARNP